jgi:hypothetical protein
MNTAVVSNQENSSMKHSICFVALPFGDRDTFRYESILLPALRSVLEVEPYYWQVGCAADTYFSMFIYDNVGQWLRRAQVYIADISDLNYNVMMEFGYMFWAKQPGQPLLILERKNTGPKLADIQGVIRIPYSVDYPAVNDVQVKHAIEDLADSLRESFNRISEMQILYQTPREHFLSSLWIKKKCSIDPDTGKAVSHVYTTMEAIETASIEDIVFKVSNYQHIDFNPFFAECIQSAVVTELKLIRRRGNT